MVENISVDDLSGHEQPRERSLRQVLDTFDNGLPQVAFHGTNQPELVGTKASNGCVRIPNDIVTKIAETIPAGTPIDVFATTPSSWSAKGTGSTAAVTP